METQNETIDISMEIVFMSGHYPKTTYYPHITKKTIEKYTNMHGYKFYYEDEDPNEIEIHQLHFYRSYIIQKCTKIYPNATWYIWLDSDIFVNKYNLKVEDIINLKQPMLYHLFHENPWGCYPINTGVKFVHRDALKYEEEVWNLRNDEPWKNFPFEQKTIYEYVLPKIPNQYIIHDPYVLNCIIKAYPSKIKDALFLHMCGTSETDRDSICKTLETTI